MWRASLNCRKQPTRLSAATSNSDSVVACQGCWTRIRCFRSRSLNLCNHAEELTLAWMDCPVTLCEVSFAYRERDCICNNVCSLLIIVGAQRNVKKDGSAMKFTLKENDGTKDVQNCEIPRSNKDATWRRLWMILVSKDGGSWTSWTNWQHFCSKRWIVRVCSCITVYFFHRDDTWYFWPSPPSRLFVILWQVQERRKEAWMTNFIGLSVSTNNAIS